MAVTKVEAVADTNVPVAAVAESMVSGGSVDPQSLVQSKESTSLKKLNAEKKPLLEADSQNEKTLLEVLGVKVTPKKDDKADSKNSTKVEVRRTQSEIRNPAKGLKKATKKCSLCGLEGHEVSMCTSQTTCASCKKIGHNADQCPLKSDAQELRCDSCGKKGHLASKCYALEVCTFCHRKGHLESICFDKKRAKQETSKKKEPEKLARKEEPDSKQKDFRSGNIDTVEEFGVFPGYKNEVSKSYLCVEDKNKLPNIRQFFQDLFFKLGNTHVGADAIKKYWEMPPVGVVSNLTGAESSVVFYPRLSGMLGSNSLFTWARKAQKIFVKGTSDSSFDISFDQEDNLLGCNTANWLQWVRSGVHYEAKLLEATPLGVFLRLRRRNTAEVDSPISRRLGVSEIEITHKYWYLWKRTVKYDVDDAMLSKGRLVLVGRTKNQFNFQSLVEGARRDWVSAEVWKNFPCLVGNILEEHIYLISSYRILEDSLIMNQMALDTNKGAFVYNNALKGTPTYAHIEEILYGTKVLAAVGCGLLGAYCCARGVRGASRLLTYWTSPTWARFTYDVCSLVGLDSKAVSVVVQGSRLTDYFRPAINFVNRPWIRWAAASTLMGAIGYSRTVLSKWLPVKANVFGTTWSPMVEELVKGVSGGVLCVSLLDMVVSGDVRTALFHLITSFFPFPLRLALHYQLDYWEQIKRNLYLDPIASRVPIKECGVVSFPYCEGYLPRQVDANYVRPEISELNPVSGLNNLTGARTVARVYTCFCTNVPAYAIQDSASMVRAGLECRVLKKPLLAPLIQKERWDNLPFNLGVPTHTYIPYDLALEYWIGHIKRDQPKKAKLYERVIREGEMGFVPKLSFVSIFLKRDEFLLKPDFSLKPRVIANVPAMVQVACGPYIRLATERLKHLWDGRVWDGVRLAIGSGRTNAWLTDWMQLVLSTPNLPAILVAGDDSIVWTGTAWYCADASAYDQSQSFGPLAFAYRIYARLGVPPEITGLLQKVSQLPYFYASLLGKVVIKRKLRPIRDTGGPDTTLGNSINMAAAWFYALHQDRPYGEAFAHLGFDMKMHEVDLWHCNFLKGTWVPCDTGMCWYPLPSKILKCGFCKKDPVLIYKKPIRLAAQAHLNAVACSFRYAIDVPLLRTFVKRFYKNVVPFEAASVYVLDVGRPLDSLAYFANFYSVPIEWLIEVEQMIATMEIPGMMSHPLFERLAACDYG